MNNVYYSPEAFELTILGTLDEPDMSYEYNTFLVVCHTPSGRVFWGSDSGCSCPIPFESYYFRGPDDTDLSEVQFYNFSSFEREVNSFCDEGRIPQHEKDELIDVVRGALKGLGALKGRE